MKKVSKRNLRFKYRLRSRPGISLVEVIIVLGISSMLIAGSFAWFDSRKSSDFYDQMRQLESRIREVQSENTSNVVPGYSSGDCSPMTPACPLHTDEEVYATGVSMAIRASSPELKIWYLKKNAPIAIPPQAETIESYYTNNVVLPANLRFEGYKVFPPNASGVCPAATLDGYRNLPHLEASSVGETSITAADSESLLVFRRTTGSYNAFNNPAGAVSITPNSVTTAHSRPTYPNGNSNGNNPAWRGSYNDSSYIYNPLPNSAQSQRRLLSQPCAVLWRFGSVERSASDNTVPRFTAEINFNLVDGTTTLVTR